MQIPNTWCIPDLKQCDYLCDILSGGDEIMIRSDKIGLSDKSSSKSDVKFYMTELNTNEFRICTGPTFVDESGNDYYRCDHMWGYIEPGKMNYMSPGFLFRYSSPKADRHLLDPRNPKYGSLELSAPGKELLEKEMYSNVPANELENIIKFIQEFCSRRGNMFIKLMDGAHFRLLASVGPRMYTNDDVPRINNDMFKHLYERMTVSLSDYILIFDRVYGYGDTECSNDAKHAVCLLSELRDIHFEEEEDDNEH